MAKRSAKQASSLGAKRTSWKWTFQMIEYVEIVEEIEKQ
jgi:hypothetical protein